ncbi:hypothetical protein LZG04_19570 [Saccharothrix sp. S26]|nr:hypothetical protein [Saccharothrix sp. S26]MCE6996986.1 hypothetical protein [Saccharothrix sp. S26]
MAYRMLGSLTEADDVVQDAWLRYTAPTPPRWRTPDPDPARQREVVDGFFAAARDGDLDALVAVLDPDVVLRSDAGAGSRFPVTLPGARTVAGQAVTFGRLLPLARPALVNGVAGVVVAAEGRPLSVMAFTVTGGRVVAIDVPADAERLQQLLVLPDQREGDAPAVPVEG